jgi:uncharacterized membrane protein YphA (DoxX/SURF4 family)
VVGWLCGAAVGIALGTAGVLKLFSPQWLTQASMLGVAPALARAVPWVEVGLGACLVADLARQPVALLAIALLASFTSLLAWRLAHGVRPPCACFGRLSTRPVGPATLARNAFLIALAVVAAVV